MKPKQKQRHAISKKTLHRRGLKNQLTRQNQQHPSILKRFSMTMTTLIRPRRGLKPITFARRPPHKKAKFEDTQLKQLNPNPIRNQNYNQNQNLKQNEGTPAEPQL